MVRVRAGDRGRAFHHVQPVHLEPSARGRRRRSLKSRAYRTLPGSSCRKLRVQREDAVRRDRNGRSDARPRPNARPVARAHAVPATGSCWQPRAAGKRQELPKLAGEGGRGDRSRQQRAAPRRRAADRLQAGRHVPTNASQSSMSPRCCRTFCDRSGSYNCSSEPCVKAIRRAQARRVLRVALQLRRPAHLALRQHALGIAAARESGRINTAACPAPAAPAAPRTARSSRGGCVSAPPTPASASVAPITRKNSRRPSGAHVARRLVRKLPLQVLLKLLRLRELLQAPPGPAVPAYPPAARGSSPDPAAARQSRSTSSGMNPAGFWISDFGFLALQIRPPARTHSPGFIFLVCHCLKSLDWLGSLDAGLCRRLNPKSKTRDPNRPQWWHVEQLVSWNWFSTWYCRTSFAAHFSLIRLAGSSTPGRRPCSRGPDRLLRVPVAVEAPLHGQRVLLPGDRHLVHPAVAGDAADALLDVDAVVEVDEVRQVVDALPLERRPVAEALPHRLQQRAVGPDLRVAGHAGLGRRDAGEGGLLHGGVAVAAVDAVVRDVVLVAERHRLLERHVQVACT